MKDLDRCFVGMRGNPIMHLREIIELLKNLLQNSLNCSCNATFRLNELDIRI